MTIRKLLVLLLVAGVAVPAVAAAKEEGKKSAKVEKHKVKKTEKVKIKVGGHNDDDDDKDSDDDNDVEVEVEWRHGHADGPANLKVTGPVHFSMEVLNGPVEVIGGAGGEVDVTSPNCKPADIHLTQSGQEVQVELDAPHICQGPFKVKVPAGSDVEVHVVNGDVSLKGTYDDVDVEAVNGDVSVDKAADVAIEAVNGKVRIGDASGKVRLETVSGDSDVGMSSPAPRLAYEAVSGGLTWNGTCGIGCRLSIETFSGQIRLGLDVKSSFTMRFASHSGEYKDELGVTVTNKPSRHEQRVKATYAKGEGSIECETFSGGLVTRKK